MGLAISSTRKWKEFYGAEIRQPSDGKGFRVQLDKESLLDLDRTFSFMNLFEQIDRNIPERTNDEETDSWQRPKRLSHVAASFHMSCGTGLRAIHLLFDASSSKHNYLFQGIMLLYECLDPDEFNDIWIQLPSVAKFAPEHLQACLHDNKKYLLDLYECARYPEEISVYRVVSYKSLYLFGGLGAAVDLNRLPAFGQGDHAKGPKKLIIDVTSHIEKTVGCFVGCMTPASVILQDHSLSCGNATEDKQLAFARSICLLPNVSTITISVQELESSARQYWSVQNWKAILSHQRIKNVVVYFDEPMRRALRLGKGPPADRLRLTNVLADALQGNTSLLHLEVDQELISWFQWDSKVVPVVRRNSLKQKALDAPNRFREWMLVQLMKKYQNEPDLSFLLLRDLFMSSSTSETRLS